METVYSKDGTGIACDRTGEGPPVVCVGGALDDRGSAAPLAAALAPHHTVITYDRRGRGDSGDTPPYAVDREMDDLAAVLGLAGGPAAVYGVSAGAVLALRAAARGLPITRLALWEPPFTPPADDRATQARAYNTELTALLADRRRGAAVELFMNHLGVPRQKLERARRTAAWPRLERLAPTLAYDSAVLEDAATGGTLDEGLPARVTVPVLVMDGGDSPGWVRAEIRRLAGLLPDGRYRTLRGQAHDADPAVVAPALREFLAG